MATRLTLANLWFRAASAAALVAVVRVLLAATRGAPWAGGVPMAIEAAPEVLELKRTLFRRLDRICPAHALLVTNSSFIVSSKLAEVTRRPEKVANMHFFVPPLAMSPVEVVQGPHTAAQTAATIAAVCTSMGKTPIMLSKEIHGFLVNRILSVIQREAQFLHDTGVASFEDIDTAVREGLGHKVGPFYQMDLIGLDLVYAIGGGHFRQSGDPSQRPSPAVVERVARNELGRKTGKGFYDYEGMLKEEMDAAAARHPDVPYRPMLIDAAYAGLLTEADDQSLVIPALNRDGDCLSDLVLAMFGSIAGAESVLLSLDDELRPTVAMAEAPHGTAPSLEGKNVANPMAMLLACAAALDHAPDAGDGGVAAAAFAIREATLGAAADGIRTFDLGGDASTSGVVDEVIRRIRTQLDG